MIDVNKIRTLADEIETEETTEGYTAFAVFAAAKSVFVELGIVDKFVTKSGRELTSQSFYNYAKNGSIDGRKYGSLKGVVFSEETVENYIATMLAKATR
jgi:tRNA G37 N-methylase TrmD